MTTTTSKASTWPLRALKVREQAPVAGVLAVLGIEPQPDGQLTCPSPTHPDRHPSARMYEDTRKVHCFGCGETWDVIGLVQAVHGSGYQEAVAFLEEAFDITEATDPALVRSILQRRAVIDHTGLINTTHAQLLAARKRMTLDQYARLWRAFDTSRVMLAARTIDEDTFVATMERILGLIPPPDARTRDEESV